MKKSLLLLIITILISSSYSYADPLRANTKNPRYFSKSNGNIVYLTGSHTWENFMDVDFTVNDRPFDWLSYLDFLKSNNHNFFRLWALENAKWAGFTTAGVVFHPLPFDRPGPGTALDGQMKFDLTSFNQSYFDRLRQRVIEAGDRGMYVSVMLFNGWAVERKGATGNPWPGHPFNRNNNINGIDGDPNQDENGQEIHTLQIPQVTAIQEAYIRKIVDTLNDLDNVLYEICNECNPQSVKWQYHMIDYIKSYQAGKPNQHPVGMTVIYPSGINKDLFSSNADWISPNSSGGYDSDPPESNGAKIIVVDTDHIWGIGGDRYWAWKSFTRGMNILFMDEYNFNGAVLDNPAWVDLRRNLGYIRNLADSMDLADIIPRGDISSSGYALAGGNKVLVYLPLGGSVSVNLAKYPGAIAVEWFNPRTGVYTPGKSITGGRICSFTAPFTGDAVLLLHSSETLTDADPPSIPTGLTTSSVSQKLVCLTWSPATDNVGVTGYYIFRNNVPLGKTEYNMYQDSTLVAGETYRYSVSAFDAAGNESAQSSTVLVATPISDKLPPKIYSIRISKITSTSATITWTTNILSDSIVEYGDTINYGKSIADATITTRHSVTLVGLTSGKLYHFRVKNKSSASSDMTFSTQGTWNWWRRWW